jgi:hypothetical protein
MHRLRPLDVLGAAVEAGDRVAIGIPGERADLSGQHRPFAVSLGQRPADQFRG